MFRSFRGHAGRTVLQSYLCPCVHYTISHARVRIKFGQKTFVFDHIPDECSEYRSADLCPESLKSDFCTIYVFFALQIRTERVTIKAINRKEVVLWQN